MGREDGGRSVVSERQSEVKTTKLLHGFPDQWLLLLINRTNKVKEKVE
jgi:hypothetical protein